MSTSAFVSVSVSVSVPQRANVLSLGKALSGMCVQSVCAGLCLGRVRRSVLSSLLGGARRKN